MLLERVLGLGWTNGRGELSDPCCWNTEWTRTMDRRLVRWRERSQNSAVRITNIRSETPFTRYNRLSNRLYNRFDNRLYRVNKHPTGCQPGCQTGLITGLTTVLNELLFVQHGCQSELYNRFDKHGLTTGCIVYTNIYPVVKPVWQPVWQQVVSCKRGLRNSARYDSDQYAIACSWEMPA